jgi:hypothetical protein
LSLPATALSGSRRRFYAGGDSGVSAADWRSGFLMAAAVAAWTIALPMSMGAADQTKELPFTLIAIWEVKQIPKAPEIEAPERPHVATALIDCRFSMSSDRPDRNGARSTRVKLGSHDKNDH